MGQYEQNSSSWNVPVVTLLVAETKSTSGQPLGQQMPFSPAMCAPHFSRDAEPSGHKLREREHILPEAPRMILLTYTCHLPSEGTGI